MAGADVLSADTAKLESLKFRKQFFCSIQI